MASGRKQKGSSSQQQWGSSELGGLADGYPMDDDYGRDVGASAVSRAQQEALFKAAEAVLTHGAGGDPSSKLAELGQQVQEQQAQLELEGRTRAELEDMLLRIERHFKAEQQARKAAEAAVGSAEDELARERSTRQRLEAQLGGRSDGGTGAERAQLLAENAALEEERARVEQELVQARAEARKAAAALATAEESVRQAEAVERMKLEADHHAKIARLAAELDRLREELDNRTATMSAEMIRWKQQADAAAAAVRDAKDELVERKKELDSTKEKMDHLVEKLYIGREKGIELRSAIDFHLERYKAVRQQDAAARTQFAAGGQALPAPLPPLEASSTKKGAKSAPASARAPQLLPRMPPQDARPGKAAEVPAKSTAAAGTAKGANKAPPPPPLEAEPSKKGSTKGRR